MASIPALDRLRQTLAQSLPYCGGTFKLPAESFELYYGKENAKFVNLGSTANSRESLDLLQSACEPAAFGRNTETVLDETYRKAGKLDASEFVIRLDVGKSGLLDVVCSSLLFGNKSRRSVTAELYKLNVYGEGAFFKSHTDTPTSGNMFGSLVVVFPTPHSGGTLVLRHHEHEWTFDSAQLLADAPGRVAYAAFFSDVEHEVTPVKSGHRITITYNLYWGDDRDDEDDEEDEDEDDDDDDGDDDDDDEDDEDEDEDDEDENDEDEDEDKNDEESKDDDEDNEDNEDDSDDSEDEDSDDEDEAVDSAEEVAAAAAADVKTVQVETVQVETVQNPSPSHKMTGARPDGANILQPPSSNAGDVCRVLSEVLQDDTLLPEGGTLGFGLRHAYPFPRTWDPRVDKDDPLAALPALLKGSDLALYDACAALGLRPELKLVGEEQVDREQLVLLDRAIQLCVTAVDSPIGMMLDEREGVRMEKVGAGFRPSQPGNIELDDTVRPVYWVTKVGAMNQFASTFIHYGNEGVLSHFYMTPCLIVDVGPVGDRKAARN